MKSGAARRRKNDETNGSLAGWASSAIPYYSSFVSRRWTLRKPMSNRSSSCKTSNSRRKTSLGKSSQASVDERRRSPRRHSAQRNRNGRGARRGDARSAAPLATHIGSARTAAMEATEEAATEGAEILPSGASKLWPVCGTLCGSDHPRSTPPPLRRNLLTARNRRVNEH